MQRIQWRQVIFSVWWAWALLGWTVLMIFLPWMSGLLYAHIMSAIIWTGSDLFLGLMLGPALNQLAPAARVPFIRHLFPRNIWMMPVIAASTITSGYFVALREHFFENLPLSLIFAGILVIVMSINGFGIILPTNYAILKFSEHPGPLPPELSTKMARFRYAVVAETILQFAVIICMVWLAQLPPK
jgi:hypothetical protein